MITKFLLFLSCFILLGHCLPFREFGNYYHSDPKVAKSFFVLDASDPNINQDDFKSGLKTIKYWHSWLGNTSPENCIVIYSEKYNFYESKCEHKDINDDWLNSLLEFDFEKKKYGLIKGDETKQKSDKFTIVNKESLKSIPNEKDIVVLMIHSGDVQKSKFNIADPFDNKRIKVLEFDVNQKPHPKNLLYLGTQFYNSFAKLLDRMKSVVESHLSIKN